MSGDRDTRGIRRRDLIVGATGLAAASLVGQACRSSKRGKDSLVIGGLPVTCSLTLPIACTSRRLATERRQQSGAGKRVDEGKGVSGKPGCFLADYAPIMGVLAPGWNIGVVAADHKGPLDLDSADVGECRVAGDVDLTVRRHARRGRAVRARAARGECRHRRENTRLHEKRAAADALLHVCNGSDVTTGAPRLTSVLIHDCYSNSGV